MTIFNSYVSLAEGNLVIHRDASFLLGGWALALWKMMEFVSWDYYYSQYMEK